MGDYYLFAGKEDEYGGGWGIRGAKSHKGVFDSEETAQAAVDKHNTEIKDVRRRWDWAHIARLVDGKLTIVSQRVQKTTGWKKVEVNKEIWEYVWEEVGDG